MAITRIGIGGWSYAPWHGSFYPAGLAQSRELEFAARKLGAIEINAPSCARPRPRWPCRSGSARACRHGQ